MDARTLDELWTAVTGTQPDPPGWLVLAAGAVALLTVLTRPLWRIARNAVTIAHEGGHGLAALATRRKLAGIRLHSDTSGLTLSWGRPTGPGMVLTAAAGYLTPALLGLGCAALLAADRITLLLWLAIALLLALLVRIRNAFGFLSVLLTGGAFFLVSWFGSTEVQGRLRLPRHLVPAVRCRPPGPRTPAAAPARPGRRLRRRPARPAHRRPRPRLGHALPRHRPRLPRPRRRLAAAPALNPGPRPRAPTRADPAPTRATRPGPRIGGERASPTTAPRLAA